MVPLCRFSGGPTSIDSLPVEILSHIFILSTLSTTPETDEQLHALDAQCITVPLIISAVSRRWRQVALSTSSLWTSLCVTPDFVLGNPAGGLDTTHIATFLHRSRKGPLHIYIDVRDPDWDFTEPGVTQTPSDYTPPLSPQHLHQALSLLLPHLSRWCTISIFTDTWSLMHAALSEISPAISTLGAPLLESMTLMRCNDFVSFGPNFQPRDLRASPLFSFDSTTSPIRRDQVLPRLRNLTLKGVHADWDSLSELLSCRVNGGLRSLELSSHSLDVRPPLPIFRSILSSSPQLQKLIVKGSGFLGCDNSTIDTDFPLQRSNASVGRTHLPSLQELQIGYRSAREGCRLLDLLDAPSLASISLCDDSHPAEAETIDSGSILNYIGTGATTTPSNVAEEPSDACAPPFPRAERLVLDKVQASESHFRASFEGLRNVRSLELKDTPLSAMRCLLPSSSSSQPPCPALKSLILYTSEALSSPGASLHLRAFLDERARGNSHPLKDISIYLDSHSAFCSPEEAIHTTMCGTDIRIYESLPTDDDSLDWITCVGDDEATAFKLGGPFNDPYFDSYYSGTIGIVTR